MWLLHDSVLGSADEAPHKAAIVDAEYRCTYAELLDESSRIARVLQDRGVAPGDRVVIRMESSWQAAAAIYGTLLAGAVFVVVSPQTKGEKAGYILDDCGAAALISDAHVVAPMLERVRQVRSVRSVLVASGDIPGTESLDVAVAATPPEPRRTRSLPVDLAALIYTSGSTGEPKGVMMTHQSMVFAASSVSASLGMSRDDRVFSVLPLAFNYGLYQLLMSVHLGATLVLERSFAFPGRAFERVSDEQISVFPGVPTIFATALSVARRSGVQLPSVRSVTNTAAALPPELVRGIRELFPNARIFSMYGLTECKRVSVLDPEMLDERPTSVGRPIPGTDAFVLDDRGRPVAPGDIGVLHVRGPHVMAGYWGKPELTAEMLKPGRVPGERVLCTQDLFTADDEGYLYFKGRTDDIIKTRGEKVSPDEVERVIYEVPGVREVAVIGIPHEVLGEAVRAYVVPDDGAQITAPVVTRACRRHLESYMVPTEVVVVPSLPRTTTGKIRRVSLARERTPNRPADHIDLREVPQAGSQALRS